MFGAAAAFVLGCHTLLQHYDNVEQQAGPVATPGGEQRNYSSDNASLQVSRVDTKPKNRENTRKVNGVIKEG